MESSKQAFREFDRLHLSQMKEEDWANIRQKVGVLATKHHTASFCDVIIVG